MYETHFGLKKRPFRALASGTDVFVGPQTATSMAGLKKALSTPDAIASVSGPIGVGKTTIVNRAVDAVGERRLIVSLGRIHLDHDEVLELLLEEMGADPIPASTVQRFTKFRRLLQEQSNKDTRVIIIVEDAPRVGAQALAELEALTATDAGVSDGASIVLMGEQMENLLGAPEMSRLRQRLRLRMGIQPLSSKELHGYFTHCFRLAGNDFDSIFEQDSAELLHALSKGIIRVANNLVESSLTAAMDNHQDRVTTEILKAVAASEYGLEAQEAEPAIDAQPEPQPAIDAQPEPDPVVEAQPEPDPVVEAQPEPDPVVEAEPEPDPVVEAEPRAELAAKPEPAEPVPVAEPVVDEDDAEDDIPELIQDTLPDLEILAPALARPAEPEKTTAKIPAWERDPTLAELRPDLDALEHAMAVAQGKEPDDDAEVDPEPVEIPELVPEITLDKQIEAKIEEAAELIKQSEQEAEEQADQTDGDKDKVAAEDKSAGTATKTPAKPMPVMTPPSVHAPLPAAAKAPEPVATKAPEPVAVEEPKPVVVKAPEPVAIETPEPAPVVNSPVEVEEPAQDATTDDSELEEIAENISRAKTIDDVDDKMAETLFGEEFSAIASQIAEKVAAESPANDELEIAGEEPAAAKPNPTFEGAAALSVEPTEAPTNPGAEPDLSATQQRLATVRALNGTPNVTPPPPPSAESIVMADAATSGPPHTSEKPESIEDQINTSITQTLKALNVRSAPGLVVEDDDEKKGFFSRFRRS